MAVERVSHKATGMGPKIPLAIIADFAKRRATHVSFHANKIQSLEIRSRNKRDEILLNANGLDHVLELDLSSNNLHEGCELAQFCPTRHSLLAMTSRLTKLVLSYNGLTEKSLRALIAAPNSNRCKPLLPCLRHINISYNNIAMLPAELHQLCPSLNRLIATCNKLKSLTSLLQTLHNFRGGKLEHIELMNKSNGTSADLINPVCTKRLYREKVLFILGSALKVLDCAKIKSEERKAARRKLAMNYEMDCNVEEHSKTHNGRCREQTPSPQYTVYASEIDCEDYTSLPKSHEDNFDHSKDQQITELEMQVASLSAIVEKQTHLTNNLLKAAQDDSGKSRESSFLDSGGQHEYHTNEAAATVKPRSADDSVVHRYKMASANAVLRMIFVEKRQRHTNLYLALSRWKLLIASTNYAQKMNHAISESKNATNEEAEKYKERLSLSVKAERVAHAKAAELTSTVKAMEQKLEAEVEQHKAEILDLNSLLKSKNSDHSRSIHRLEADLEAARKDLETATQSLSSTKEELEQEKVKRTGVEAAHKLATEAAESTLAFHTSSLEELRLYNVQKDAVIKQLKDAFEQVATRAAADRSKAEQASLSERQLNTLLQKQNRRMGDLETENERLRSVKEHLESIVAKQKHEIDLKSTTVVELSCEVDTLKATVSKKNSAIDELERKVKVAADEFEAIQRQLKECSKANSRLEMRCESLQSKLDLTNDEMRTTKECTVQRNLLDEEKSKNAGLQNELDKLRLESKAKEADLRESTKNTRREYALIHGNYLSQEKLLKSLERKLKKAQSDWESKETQITSTHNLAMEQMKRRLERESRSLQKALDSERLLRLEAERKIAGLEASQLEQKSKMQNAIEGLSKQLTALA